MIGKLSAASFARFFIHEGKMNRPIPIDQGAHFIQIEDTAGLAPGNGFAPVFYGKRIPQVHGTRIEGFFSTTSLNISTPTKLSGILGSITSSSRLPVSMSGGMTKVGKAIGRLVVVVTFLWTLLQILSNGWGQVTEPPHFGDSFLFFSVAFNVWLAVEVLLRLKPKVVTVEKELPPFPEILVRELERLLRIGEYEALLRHRKAFSRILWVEGKIRERVRLGEIAEDAAVRTDDKASQVAALVDDLGWSMVAIGKYSQAQGNIAHGLRIAKEMGDHYWIAKSHRHLAGIFVEANRFQEADSELDKAREAAAQIRETRTQKEMVAGIEYGAAMSNLHANKPSEALKHLQESEKLRREVGDRTRIVRVYSLRGKIAEASDDMGVAKDCYRKGLEEAKKIGRKDEMIRASLGLARILDAQGDKKTAEHHRMAAESMKKTTPIPYEVEDRLKEIRKLK